MSIDSEYLVNIQNSTARYFATYHAVPWVPYDDSVIERFKQSLEDESGGIILYDIVDAINTIAGEKVMCTEELVPRSKYTPDMIRSQCEQLESGGRMANVDEDRLQQSYLKVRKMYRLSNLKPLPLGEVPYDPSKNAGLPTLQHKGDVYPLSMRSARNVLKGKRPQPATAFHRGKNEERARFVLGYPHEMGLIEGMFFYPYQASIVMHHTPYAGGRYDFETAGLLNEIGLKSAYYYELDYSQFDSSISERLIRMAFSIIHDSFDMDSEEEKAFNIVVDYFIHTPMLFPDGMVYYGKDHGVPSGSTFTQLIDSIVNCICIEYVNRAVGLKAKRYLVMGDDVMMGANQKVSLEEMSKYYEQLGIHLNRDKSQVKLARVTDAHFLGHDWNRMIGVRDNRETLERLVTPERSRSEYWSKDKSVRTQAYIERIKSYQDDNFRSFILLQELIEWYRAPSGAKKEWRKYRSFQFGYSYFDQYYMPAMNPNSERTEVRWKMNKATVTPGHHRGKAAFL